MQDLPLDLRSATSGLISTAITHLDVPDGKTSGRVEDRQGEDAIAIYEEHNTRAGNLLSPDVLHLSLEGEHVVIDEEGYVPSASGALVRRTPMR